MKHFLSTKEVERIHNVYVKKSSEYLNRYSTIDQIIASGITEKYNLRGRDAPRAFTIIDFKNWIEKYKIHPKNLLTFYPGDYELAFLPRDKTTEAVFKISGEDEMYNLHSLNLPDKDFDFVLLSHTLEHLNAPEVAIANIFDHMASGGYLFASLPTISIPHSTPHHFQHLQPDGIACLMARFGFEILEVGYWGNLEYCVKMMTTQNWPDVYGLTSLQNDPNLPAQTWILVKKP